MKKFYTILFALMSISFMNTKANAADVTHYVPHKIIVAFQESFSTNNPPKTFSVIVNDNYNIKDCKKIEKGTVLYLEITKINKENIGKQNATAQARIVKVYIPSQDKTIDVEKINPNAFVKFSQYEKIDKADKAVDAGISVANYFVKNVTYPAHFVKGMVQNESGNMLKSGFQETYESSVLSYASKGKALEIKSGELATLTFYTKDIHPPKEPIEQTEE